MSNLTFEQQFALLVFCMIILFAGFIAMLVAIKVFEVISNHRENKANIKKAQMKSLMDYHTAQAKKSIDYWKNY